MSCYFIFELRVLYIPICTVLRYGICKYFLQPCRSSFHYFGGIFEVQSCVTLMKPICLGLDCTLVSNLRVRYLILSHSFSSDTQRYVPIFQMCLFYFYMYECFVSTYYEHCIHSWWLRKSEEELGSPLNQCYERLWGYRHLITFTSVTI